MNEAKGLIIEIDGETRKFDRALQKARQAQRRAADQMEKAAKRNADQMADNYEGMGNRLQAVFAKINPAAIIGTLTGVGMTRAVGNIRDVARQVAEIGNEAGCRDPAASKSRPYERHTNEYHRHRRTERGRIRFVHRCRDRSNDRG